MGTLPQLLEVDIQQLDGMLREFLSHTDARVALLLDKGGFVLTHQGEAGELDLTTLGALASGAYLASQTLAGLVKEDDFNHTVLQGEQFSLCTMNVDEHCLFVVVFPSPTGLGVVKYYAAETLRRLARQLEEARQRDPGASLDLSALNAVDPKQFFRKKAD